MIRQFVGAACLMWLAVAGPALAQTASGTVVELYTSQGCSSCPPADDYLRELASEPGVIALALHVDYWDYIGWADAFADPKFTKRQKAYAKAEGSNTIYTPQMIINGVDRVEGSDPARVDASLRRFQAAGNAVTLQVMRQGANVVIRAQSNPPLANGVQVQLVRFIPKETVSIRTGENAGRIIDYYNIVTSWAVVGQWGGSDDLQLTVPAGGGQGIAVILQAEGPGRIYAAATLP